MPAILVPVDGSANSLRALARAIAQAGRNGATVHVLNVYQPPDDYGMVKAYLSRQRYREIAAERGKAALTPAIRKLRRSRVKHVSHIINGDIAETIARTARRLKCESIIMGTRGMSALGNLVLGSVANKVLHLTAVPVTLVK
jgi:nucleotide-binding universal stress UspA family protein